MSPKREHSLVIVALVLDIVVVVVAVVVVVVVAVDGEKAKQKIIYGYSTNRILSITVRSYFCVIHSKSWESQGMEPRLI
jgi:hypothetical protein